MSASVRACARGKKDGKGILIFLIRNTANRGREREVEGLTRTLSFTHTRTHTCDFLSPLLELSLLAVVLFSCGRRRNAK